MLGPIEKGANDGQIEYVKALVAALNAAVTTKPPVKGTARKGKRKGKKEVFDAEEANAQRSASIAAEKEVSNWSSDSGYVRYWINLRCFREMPFDSVQTVSHFLSNGQRSSPK